MFFIGLSKINRCGRCISDYVYIAYFAMIFPGSVITS